MNIKKRETIDIYLPSKPIIFSMAVLCVAVGIFVYKDKYREHVTHSQISAVSVSDLANKDTDGDGISDWEESLWGTNPDKVETEAGIPDSVTIQNKKNILGAQMGISTSSIPTTQTDKFSRDLFIALSTLGKEGSSVDSNKLGEALASSTLEQLDKQSTISLYTKSALQTSGSSRADIVNYKKAVFSAFLPSGDKKVLAEYELIYQAVVVTGDTKTLEKAASYAMFYNKILQALLTIPVPSQYQEGHLRLINSVLYIKTALMSIAQMQSDKLPGASIFNMYNQGLTGAFSELDIIQKIQ